MVMGSTTVIGGLPAIPRWGMAPQLFWKNRSELLACSLEEHEAFVKLVTGARETEQMASALGRDILHAGAWSTLPVPALKVGGRSLLCSLTDLPREIELPSVVPSTCK